MFYWGSPLGSISREALHISDDTGSIALVDTFDNYSVNHPVPNIRFNYPIILGSAALELDNIASYHLLR